MNILIKGLLKLIKSKSTISFMLKTATKLGLSKVQLAAVLSLGMLGASSYLSFKLTYNYLKSDYTNFKSFVLDNFLKKLGLITSKELNELTNNVQSLKTEMDQLKIENSNLTTQVLENNNNLNTITNQMNDCLTKIEGVTEYIANETGSLQIQTQGLKTNLSQTINLVDNLNEKINRTTDQIQNNINVLSEELADQHQSILNLKIRPITEHNTENGASIEIDQRLNIMEENLQKIVNSINTILENFAINIPVNSDSENSINKMSIPLHQIDLKIEQEDINDSLSMTTPNSLIPSDNELESSNLEFDNYNDNPYSQIIKKGVKKGLAGLLDYSGYDVQIKTENRPPSAFAEKIQELKQRLDSNNFNPEDNNEKISYNINFGRISTSTTNTTPFTPPADSTTVSNDNLPLTQSNLGYNPDYKFYNPNSWTLEAYEKAASKGWLVSFKYKVFGLVNWCTKGYLNLGLDPEVTRLLSGNLTQQDIINLQKGVSTPAYDVYNLFYKKTLGLVPPHISQSIAIEQQRQVTGSGSSFTTTSSMDQSQTESNSIQLKPIKPKFSLSTTSITLRRKDKGKQKLLTDQNEKSDNDN